MSIILLTPVLNLVDITKSKSSAPNYSDVGINKYNNFGE